MLFVISFLGLGVSSQQYKISKTEVGTIGYCCGWLACCMWNVTLKSGCCNLGLTGHPSKNLEDSSDESDVDYEAQLKRFQR